MRVVLLVAFLTVTSPLVAHSQNQAPAKPLPAANIPRINSEATALLDATRARYAALRSYSDKVEAHLEKADKWPQAERDRMTVTATLAFERPSKLRFEGRNPKGTLLLVNDGTTTHILNPEHQGEYLQRSQISPLNLRDDFSRPNVALPPGATPLIESGWTDTGATLLDFSLFLRPQLSQDGLDFLTDTTLDADETIDGEECRVVQQVTDYGEGNTIGTRFWIAKKDGLFRRITRSFGASKDAPVMIETHSEVRFNPELPPTTWDFAIPTGAKLTDQFPPPYPVAYGLKVKLGDTLPVFSQDGLNDEPVELNPQSGKVTLLFFFFANLATADAPSVQRLQTTLGAQKINVAAAAGDNKRERVQSLITKAQLKFPIYFEDTGYRNQLATLFGVRGWPLVLLFDRDAKLRAIAQRPGDPEFVKAIEQQFPDVPRQTLVDALMGPTKAAP